MDVSTAEVERVSHHIANAQQHAARRDVSQLTHLQRIVRQLLLRALPEYRADGRFPQNRDFKLQTPYFIDANGTRCAMAHLLELGGEHDLVARIARERNNAYVRELADEPRLLEWLVEAGLTVEEAAAIQPSYCSAVTSCICGGDFSSIDYPVPARGVLEGVVQDNGKARIENTYGDTTGFTIGTEVALASAFAPGTLVLAPVDGTSTTPLGAVPFADDVYRCHSQGVSTAPGISPEQFVQVTLATDCVAELRSIDSGWRKDPPCDSSGGAGVCNSGSGTAGVGILLALVAALARRSR